MRQQWDDFRAACAFLTIFPVARSLEFSNARLARSLGLFPAVGLLLGLALVVCNWLLTPLFPRAVLDGLLLLLLICASGALHLDGLADMLDGLAGSRDPARSLQIMKDSRIGAMGAVGLVMVLLLKYLSLAQLPLEQKAAGLLLMPAAGRWCQVFLATCSSYVRAEGGTGSVFVDQVGRSELIRATLTLLLAALILCGFKGLLLSLSLLVFAALLLHYFERRLGGVSGDILGASSELVEVYCLLVILALY